MGRFEGRRLSQGQPLNGPSHRRPGLIYALLVLTMDLRGSIKATSVRKVVKRVGGPAVACLLHSQVRMNLSRTSVALVIGLASLAGSCASDSTPQQKGAGQNQRAILNEGYSILYRSVSNLSKVDLIFLVKSESEPVNQLTTVVTEYADALKKTLEGVAKDYPAVTIALDPLPVIEQRTREAITKDRLLSFAPIVGLKGESFDRRMLQSLEGMLNHLRFLTKTLADEEPEASLKQIAATAHTKFEQLYARVLDMLRDKYYINTGERKVAR